MSLPCTGVCAVDFDKNYLDFFVKQSEMLWSKLKVQFDEVDKLRNDGQDRCYCEQMAKINRDMQDLVHARLCIAKGFIRLHGWPRQATTICDIPGPPERPMCNVAPCPQPPCPQHG